MGIETHIDTSLIEKSGYLKPSLLGWQLIYILPVAILTNDFFISGFWLRTFAAKTDKDLWIGVSIATVAVTAILVLVGSTGLLATWSGALPIGSENGYIAFFLLLGKLPAWVVGIVLVMVVALSTAVFDSFQTAMISSGSNDLFRNKLNLWWIRLAVIVIIIPSIIVALKSPNILQIYLISDLVSASTIPVLVIGLWDKMYWWRGFEVVVGGLGGIVSVFIFGTIYYGNAQEGANLILLEEGLYTNDWSAFGTLNPPLLSHTLKTSLILDRRLRRRPSRWFHIRHRGPHPSFVLPMDVRKSKGQAVRCFRSSCVAAASYAIHWSRGG